ncbi:dehydrogenase of unknown specificity, short-chain alcohol dehydrogenase like [Spongiibacter sp. IMCC21906]|uniref:SDR family NAD(P)-dependent oxidoreductase n=1 Tax=Spongiibacter sp. IMCC21906 TaxID=1620392 RepID=UPI00062DD1A2|nr:SDR family oxidoreductase [Spongiibacter sp. IMCC21906]AKH70444.1 dehydrogenase of unknown specificity, short-chain alcohol dehydrogenase like [Spongiibacter sp. IMCC21906]
MTKLLIVTGGSQGIGLAAAERFQAEGYQVVNISRRPTPLQNALHIGADMAQLDWLQACRQQLLELVANASEVVLLHNAARQEFDKVTDLAADNFRHVLQINLVAPQELNRLLIPEMKRGSAVIYIGSTLSEKAVAGTTSYVASKHAVIGLMKATVQDLNGKGIHSACVCPGFTDTDMLRSQIGGNQEVLAAITGMVTQGRLISPVEIADSIWFCATNPVINGSVIHANLGQVEN